MEHASSNVIKRATLVDFTQTISPCCPGWGDCNRSWESEHMVSQTLKGWNLSDHRYRPYQPELSPTNLPIQTETVYEVGRIVSRNRPMGTYWCDDLKETFSITRDMWQDVVPPGAFLVNFPEVDWSMDMRNKIADTKVNLSSSIAEYKDVGRTFLQLTSTLHNAYKALRHGDFNHLLKEAGTIKNIAAAHLLYDFGIKPLCHDLGAGVAALLKAEKPIIRRYVVMKRESDEKPNIANYKVEAKISKLAIVYVTMDDNWSSIEIGNPIEWAWEIIPFSFVVDWAFPIGDWLGSLDAMNGVKSAIGTVTTKREYIHTLTGTDQPLYTVEKPAVMKYKSHERSVVINDIPIPPFPGYEPSTAFRNVAQGLSLLTLIHRGR